MSRDPFSHLRESNPMPDDHPVYPPMSTAERIAGGKQRRPWPAWALAGGLALAVLVGGGAWLLWARDGKQPEAATTAPATTLSASTTGQPSTTTALAFPEGDAVVYFFVEDDGTQVAPGPYLIAVARPYAVLSHMVEDPVYETLNFLVIGTYPGEEDAGPALLSYIPEGTQVLGVEVGAEGTATVDLSREFLGGSGQSDVILDPDAVRRAVAQVVYTLARFPEIAQVCFLVEGEPAAALEGLALSGPVARGAFQDLLPPIMIESPVYFGSGGENPLPVDGTADVFEATVSLELLAEDGTVLWEGFTTATCGTGCRGGFSVDIPYEVADAQFGTLVAWETSMEDGSRLYERRHRVWLNATPGVTTTTVPDPIAEQLALRYDLDKALDTMLEELAAIYAQLAGLPIDQGAELRTRAAQIDRQVSEVREGLSRVFDELARLSADFEIPCSAEVLGSELTGQPDLPQAVADLRYQVYEAVRGCYWDQLPALLEGAGDFSYSFGESGDPVTFWQRMEFLHYQPMLYMAGMLARPFGVVESDGLPIYAWPSAHAYGSWVAVPEAEKQALKPLYDEADFGFFEEFGGYVGYRVGITLDGDWAQWVYAISGD